MLPSMRPLPEPRLPLLMGLANTIAEVWRAYLRELDGRVRGLTGLNASAEYDPPNLTSGSTATTTVSVAGAELGQFVMVSFSQPTQGIAVSAWVSAVNTVTVRFHNQTGGTINLGAGLLSVRVLPT